MSAICQKCGDTVKVPGNRYCGRCATAVRKAIAEKFPYPVSVKRRRDPEHMPARDDANPWGENAVRCLEDGA